MEQTNKQNPTACCDHRRPERVLALILVSECSLAQLEFVKHDFEDFRKRLVCVFPTHFVELGRGPVSIVVAMIDVCVEVGLHFCIDHTKGVNLLIYKVYIVVFRTACKYARKDSMKLI
jgi:hypothetical protein